MPIVQLATAGVNTENQPMSRGLPLGAQNKDRKRNKKESNSAKRNLYYQRLTS